MMRRKLVLLIALLCVAAMASTGMTYADSTVSGKLIKPDKKYIEFGSYPQTEIVGQAGQSGVSGSGVEGRDYVVDADLYSELESGSTVYDSKGDTTIDGVKYRRLSKSDATNIVSSFQWSDDTSYHYFRYDPIIWRVLNSGEGDAFLMAETVLDDQKYNSTDTSLTWEVSGIRSWLNSDFTSTAFTADELAAVKTTTVVNGDNGKYGTSGGAYTQDRVYLLSLSETYGSEGEAYGFNSDSEASDTARAADTTTFAKAMGTITLSNVCQWWLRSPGQSSNYAAYIGAAGAVDIYGVALDFSNLGVRPVLHLNTGITDVWSYVATDTKSDATISQSEYDYDGTEKTPAVTVEGLTAGTDYTVSYEDNVNAGTAKAIVTGKGDWMGSLTRTYTIAPKQVSGMTIQIAAGSTYTSREAKPSVTVKDGDKELVSGTDYTISYEDNVNAGTAKAIATGQGNYTGTLTGTFTIEKADPVLSAGISALTKKTTDSSFTSGFYSKSDGKRTYSSDNTDVATIDKSGIITLKGVGTATITATIAATSNYTAASSSFTLTVIDGNKKNISETTVSAIADQAYTGSAIEPEFTVKDGEKTLVMGIDYTVEFSDNTNAGQAAVTITGMGDYAGTKQAAFTIKAKSIEDMTATLSETSYNYDGTAKEPAVTIEGLTQGSDFDVEYSDNIRGAIAKAEITGKGNYTGSLTITFSIAYEKAIQDVIDAIEALPAPEDITTGDYQAVINATDKYVELTEEQRDIFPSDVFEKLLKVQKALNTLLKEKSIIDISHYVNTVAESVEYTGQALQPEVTVEGLTAGSDYQVECSNNVDIGLATAVIKGTGKYKGEITKTFTILPAKASLTKVSKGKKKLTAYAAEQAGGVSYQFYVKRSGKSAKYYTSTTTKRVVKKLTRKKTYTVKVRAYKTVDGTTYYGAWSETKKVKVK